MSSLRVASSVTRSGLVETPATLGAKVSHVDTARLLRYGRRIPDARIKARKRSEYLIREILVVSEVQRSILFILRYFREYIDVAHRPALLKLPPLRYPSLRGA
jgi:hypothetical protein